MGKLERRERERRNEKKKDFLNISLYYISQLSGAITNTGHSVIFYAGPWEEEIEVGEGGGGFFGGNSIGASGGNSGSSSNASPKTLVNMTGGPLSYRYQFHEIHIHYGLRDDGGSEHTVDGYAFPAEVTFALLFIRPGTFPFLHALGPIRMDYLSDYDSPIYAHYKLQLSGPTLCPLNPTNSLRSDYIPPFPPYLIPFNYFTLPISIHSTQINQNFELFSF